METVGHMEIPHPQEVGEPESSRDEEAVEDVSGEALGW